MNIEDLFKWNKELEIQDQDGAPVIMDGDALVLYQRVVGDAEQSKARRKALEASAKLRSELRHNAPGEYSTYFGDIESMDNEDLKNAIVLSEMPRLRQRARDQAMLPPKPKKPTDSPTLEEQEQYQQDMDAYDEEVEEVVDAKTDELVKARREELKGLHRDTLVGEYREGVIDAVCRSEMMTVYNSWCAYLGTHKDEAMTKRAFSSYEKFENASALLKEQVIAGYIHLELTGDELKK